MEAYQNYIALAVTFGVCLGDLHLFEALADRGVLSSEVSRKLVRLSFQTSPTDIPIHYPIHICTGPLYLLCWKLFDDSPSARYFAALVPLAMSLKVALVALGVLKDEKTVKSMSRTGRRAELLRGPLSYGLIFVWASVVYWRYDANAIISLMLLCAGDGFAGLIGKKYGRTRLPYSREKSLQGSLAFIGASLVFIAAYLQLFSYWNWLPAGQDLYGPSLLVVVAGAGLAESLPLGEWDNVIVFFTSLVLRAILPA